MKSRRRIAFTKGLRHYPALEQGGSNQETATSGIELLLGLRNNNPSRACLLRVLVM
jgi:hypothetical protein